jgi:hypothetical protein
MATRRGTESLTRAATSRNRHGAKVAKVRQGFFEYVLIAAIDLDGACA